jgi:transcriptional regulator with XRE-family HTH domain
LEIQMDAQRTPSLRTQALGKKMRELRTSAAVDLAEAAQHIGRDKSGVSRKENGFIPISAEVLDSLLTLYGIRDPAEREGLLRFNREVWRTGWWDGYADQVHGSLIDHVWLEERATRIQAFNIAAIDGLLQTPEYARALMLAQNPDQDLTEIENWVDLRMRRQVILTRSHAPNLTVVLSEAALWSRVGGVEVLAAQLRYLIERAQRPNIDVRVIPFGDGSQAGVVSDFRIFTMPEPFPEVVLVEATGGLIYREPPGTERILASYDRLEARALGPEESRAFIEAVADGLEDQ